MQPSSKLYSNKILLMSNSKLQSSSVRNDYFVHWASSSFWPNLSIILFLLSYLFLYIFCFFLSLNIFLLFSVSIKLFPLNMSGKVFDVRHRRRRRRSKKMSLKNESHSGMKNLLPIPKDKAAKNFNHALPWGGGHSSRLGRLVSWNVGVRSDLKKTIKVMRIALTHLAD